MSQYLCLSCGSRGDSPYCPDVWCDYRNNTVELLECPDAMHGWPANQPPQERVTDVEVYKFNFDRKGTVNVQVFVDANCAFVAEFHFNKPVQRALNWVAENYPNRKVRVNV